MATPKKEVETNPEPVAPSPEVAPVTQTVPDIPKGARSYLVMMLLAVLLAPTGLARAYRGEQLGWTRFWIFIGIYAGSILLFWVPLLNILIILALIGLYVWGAVDVFQLYKTKTDAEGGSLTTTPRDEKFARGFYIFFIVALILSGVGILLALIFGAIFASYLMNMQNGSGENFPGLDSGETRWLEEYNSQYR